ncbi:MAG: hypothetical protein Harvfovirus5_39 [Harvfovirus sp.]|uniref:Uncharacterized protein n=1 Tax=Harvfovirus sp. TaxID=2487768 RepID=A0A3G5A0L9_9VIRU|nr:MAG: hypothetical protein Harvfovirus5_39 [Harvfovirus sp.]
MNEVIGGSIGSLIYYEMAAATVSRLARVGSRVGSWVQCDSILSIRDYQRWMINQFSHQLTRCGVIHAIVEQSWFVHDHHAFMVELKSFCDQFQVVLERRRLFFQRVASEIARYVWDFHLAIERCVEQTAKKIGKLTLVEKFRLESKIADELKQISKPSISWKIIQVKKPDETIVGHILSVRFPLGEVYLPICDHVEIFQLSREKLTDSRQLNSLITLLLNNTFLQGVRSKEELLPKITSLLDSNLFLTMEEAYGFYQLGYAGKKQRMVSLYEFPFLEVQKRRTELYLEMLSQLPDKMTLREILQALHLDFFTPEDGWELGKRICAIYLWDDYQEKKEMMVNGEPKMVNVYHQCEYPRIVQIISQYHDETRKPNKITCHVYCTTALNPDVAVIVGEYLD